LIIISAAIFGKIVLPEVWDYDATQDKVDKKKAKLERVEAIKLCLVLVYNVILASRDRTPS